MNQVTLLGRMTANPDLKETKSEKKYLNFSVAVNEKYKDEEYTTFVSCMAWGAQAETISHYFVKGKPILISGRLAVNKWEDEEGKKHNKMYVSVRNFEFVPKDNHVSNGATATSTEPDGFAKTSFGDGWVSADDMDVDIPF